MTMVVEKGIIRRLSVRQITEAAAVTLRSNLAKLATIRIPRSTVLAAGNGEALDIGPGLGVSVTEY